MRIRDLLESYLDGCAEIRLELSSDHETRKVKVECEYEVEPTEYEGGYVFFQGGAVLGNFKITPFDFLGKHYTNIVPELIQYLETSKAIEVKYKSVLDKARRGETPSKKDADAIVSQLVDEVFDRTVDVEIPSKRYPMTR